MGEKVLSRKTEYSVPRSKQKGEEARSKMVINVRLVTGGLKPAGELQFPETLEFYINAYKCSCIEVHIKIKHFLPKKLILRLKLINYQVL